MRSESANPPQTSTTGSPSTNTATEAPASPASSSPASALGTAVNRSSYAPWISAMRRTTAHRPRRAIEFLGRSAARSGPRRAVTDVGFPRDPYFSAVAAAGRGLVGPVSHGAGPMSIAGGTNPVSAARGRTRRCRGIGRGPMRVLVGEVRSNLGRKKLENRLLRDDPVVLGDGFRFRRGQRNRWIPPALGDHVDGDDDDSADGEDRQRYDEQLHNLNDQAEKQQEPQDGAGAT